jgi:hypothetical protein
MNTDFSREVWKDETAWENIEIEEFCLWDITPYKSSDVSQEHIASIFKQTRIKHEAVPLYPWRYNSS